MTTLFLIGILFKRRIDGQRSAGKTAPIFAELIGAMVFMKMA